MSTRAHRPRRLGGLLGELGLLAGSLLAGLVLAELALRLAGISYPQFYRDDVELGSAHREHAAGWWTQEGRGWVEINSAGMRDREHRLRKPEGTFRIAVLGDSYAAAFEVDQADAFWAVLERELAHCGALHGRTVEVLNFGVAGYGTAQEYRMLETRVWAYAPDLVVLSFLAGNDVRNNSWKLDGNRRALYYILKDGELIPDPDFLEHRGRLSTSSNDSVWNALYARLRTAQLYDQARRLIKAWRRGLLVQPPALSQPEAGLDSPVFAPPTDPTWQEAWAVTEALVRKFASAVRERGARLVVVLASSGIQVHPEPGVRAGHAKALGIDDLSWPDRKVAGWARELGIPHVALAPDLLAWAEANATCVHGFENASVCGGHWNEHGHRLAGERTARLICDEALGLP